MSGRPAGRPRVLFICADPVGERMAGLGIRYSELAAVLAPYAEVTVAHGGQGAGRLASGAATLPYAPHAPSALREPIAAADVVVAHPQWPLVTRWLRGSGARVIFDLYDPETLETLELSAGRRLGPRRLHVHSTLDRLHDALHTGHHFMCASEKQRDLWLGAMLGLRLVDPATYDADPSLRSVLDAVPSGVPSTPPDPDRATGHGPRERFIQLAGDSELVLWNGGIWKWLDAETAVRAVASLSERRPRLRLVFMGGSTGKDARTAAQRARAVARELGLLDRTVIFHDGWVPYAERAAWLAQADCAISTHREHLETRFAFRTRLLDCFWAGLPVVCTEGDDLADRVERDGLGATAAAGDRDGVAAALERVLDEGREHHAERLARAAADYSWGRVAKPLLGWVTAPGAPGSRPGDAPGALRRGAGQTARSLGYRLGARHVLALRGGLSPAGRRRWRRPRG